jgi:hypothetical protein
MGRRCSTQLRLGRPERRLPPHSRIPSPLQPLRPSNAQHLHRIRLAHWLAILQRPLPLRDVHPRREHRRRHQSQQLDQRSCVYRRRIRHLQRERDVMRAARAHQLRAHRPTTKLYPPAKRDALHRLPDTRRPERRGKDGHLVGRADDRAEWGLGGDTDDGVGRVWGRVYGGGSWSWGCVDLVWGLRERDGVLCGELDYCGVERVCAVSHWDFGGGG